MPRLGLLLGGAAVFGTLALLNVGGYRYGVSDQAFYIPIVLQGLQPELYPHDSSLLAAQNRFFAFDDWLVPILRTTGVSLSVAFLVGYGFTLALLYVAAIRIGRGLHMSDWSIAGLVVALTLRHRVPYTPVNTLESYFHPRLLAFAVGVTAVGVFLKGRTWPAFVILGLAFLVHPTTAGWFAIWLGTAALLSDRDARRPLMGLAVACAAAVALVATGPLRGQLVMMDQAWAQLLTAKDYLTPTTDWSALTWIANLALAAIIGAIYWYRRKLRVHNERETGLVAGCGALLAMFLLSVPLSSAHVALVVQLQLSRIFWLLDLLATAYVCWWAIESPLWRAPRPPMRVRRAVVLGLAVLALARGSYVMFVERAGHPIVGQELPATDWNAVMAWAAGRPVGTNFLADPGHAWRYGSSVRAASGRDVYLEEAKDIGIAIYSRDVAHEVIQRIGDLGDFSTLDATRARALARRYDLDYLITDRLVDLPEVHATGPFRVYALQTE